MKYYICYTKKDGERVENQIYTTENITKALQSLEEWGAHDILIQSIEKEDTQE